MDRVREGLRYYRYDYRPEQTHAPWILRYIHDFGGKTHPNRCKARWTGYRSDYRVRGLCGQPGPRMVSILPLQNTRLLRR